MGTSTTAKARTVWLSLLGKLVHLVSWLATQQFAVLGAQKFTSFATQGDPEAESLAAG